MTLSKNVPSILLVLLILVILASSAFALYKLHKLRGIERSPFIAIVSTSLGTKPKLLNIKIKAQDFISTPNKKTLKALKTSIKINRASILNDLNSTETLSVHERMGNLQKLSKIVKALYALDQYLPEHPQDVESAKTLYKKLSRLYQKWNVYSRSYIQKTQVIHDQFLKNLDRALTILLTLLIVIGSTSILASILIYRQYKNQKSLSQRLFKQTQELTIARDQAEEGIQEKSRFLSNISHELRTPLNGVIGLSNLAFRHATDPQIQSYLKDIKKSGDLLLKLINNVLDINKIESDKIEFENREYDLWALLNTLSASLYSQAAEKGLYFLIELPPNVPRYIKGDETRLNQILINLVSNAIKFTESGGVRLGINLTSKKNQSRITFSVIDTGIGISNSAQSKIFNEFSQEDESTTRKFGGTGLGLTICKRLVEKMGGKLRLESQENTGSQFYFDLPTNLDSTKLKTIPLEEHMNIGLLIDNIALVELIESDLSNWNIHTKGQPNIWIYYPNNETSSQRIQHIQKDDIVIVFSPIENIESFSQRLPSDNIIHLLPPYAAYKLINALKDENNIDPFHTSKNNTTERPNALSGMHILIAEDIPLNQVVAQEFVESLGGTVCIAENGEECLEQLNLDHFDLILMDIHMPILDGVETTKRIREQRRFDNLPIIALTANIIKDDINTYFEVGMDAYLAKPFDPKDFEKVIINTLNRR